jgi:hypothetical protein
MMKTRAARRLAPIIVGGCLLNRSPGGRRWDYAVGYAGIGGRKIAHRPGNPGYSRVIPRNEFQEFLAGGPFKRQNAEGRTQKGAKSTQVVDFPHIDDGK